MIITMYAYGKVFQFQQQSQPRQTQPDQSQSQPRQSLDRANDGVH